MATHWNWTARDPDTGRDKTFHTQNGPDTREDFFAHVREHFRNLDFSHFTCEVASKPPTIIYPVPAHYYNFGLYEAVGRELAGLPDPLIRSTANGSIPAFAKERRRVNGQRIRR